MFYIVGVQYYSEVTENRLGTQVMDALAPVSQLGTNTYSLNAKAVRNKLKDYFSNEGAVSFQYDRII